MLYHLFTYLDKAFDFPGAGMFNFISFRTGLAFILALILSTTFGRRIIDYFLSKSEFLYTGNNHLQKTLEQ
jgi:phospho-N-acetylmuramoyl-pentapeptide-transferase